MKQFTVITVIITLSVLAILVFLQTVPGLGSSPEAKFNAGDKLPVSVSGAESRRIAPAPVYDANGTIVDLNSNQSGDAVSRVESRKVAPVFDSSGALVSDPTGTILRASPVKIAPVFDASGAVVSDPTGTLWSASHP